MLLDVLGLLSACSYALDCVEAEGGMCLQTCASVWHT